MLLLVVLLVIASTNAILEVKDMREETSFSHKKLPFLITNVYLLTHRIVTIY